MGEVDLDKYKIQGVGMITGVEPDKLDESLVTGACGYDVVNKAKEILKKHYESISELCGDLAQLKSDVDFYVFFD